MSRNETLWMWAEACDVLERADRLQRQFFHPARGSAQAGWEPPVDVFESGHALWVIVALPGVAPDDVELIIDGNMLIVAGLRSLPRELRGAAIHRLELPAGRFERRIALQGRFELVERRLENGCLTLGLHKR
ncbi:MAG: heat shock protein Hsp20 [Hydrocarboniphaga sp.]|uniref:Hsp20/alpha crystallin family protein n=1 Tax=Hydrocarboniphaga sp. TaxID=2033016 RepID=UPI00262BAA78|nr:Hsp20/alpha crystallin family protein [Hydrocarboniphaga sp.]MDB5971221.1 heat shock protein Hsp20 [Hydrocarboniphaga sp.]